MVSRRGSVFGGCLTWLMAIALIVYVGSRIGEPYYRYYRYRDAISQQVRFATVRPDSAILTDIWAHADSIGMPEQAYHVQLLRADSALRITTSWTDSWRVLNYTREVPFHIDTFGGR